MISFVEIRDLLGGFDTYVPTLEDLCRNNNINKWSLHKPVLYNDKKSDLTEEDLGSINYGYLDYMGTTNFYMSSRANLWRYSKPEKVFRLGDFKNYDHYNKFIDFINETATDTITVGNNIRCIFSDSLDVMLNNFKAITDFTGNIYLCILILSGDHTGYIYRHCLVNNYDYDTIRIPTSNTMLGTYTVVPVLTNNSFVNNMSDGEIWVFQNWNGKYWVFPEYCEFNITIENDDYNLFNYVFHEIHYAEWTLNESTYILNNIIFDPVLNLSGAVDNYDWNISVYYIFTNAINEEVQIGHWSATLNKQGTTNITTRMTYLNDIEVMTIGKLDELLPVKIQMTITHNNISQTRTWTEQLEMGKF